MREPVEIEPRRPFRGSDIGRRFKEQEGRCALCPKLIQFAGGPPSVLGASFFISDHRVPRAMGGKTSFENLQLICLACDSDKTHGKTGDISRVAKAKRIARKADPEARKKAKRPIRSRGFDRSLKKKLSGEVVSRG